MELLQNMLPMNFSRLKSIEAKAGGSPLALWWMTKEGLKDSPAMLWGRVFHARLLTPLTYDEEVAVWQGEGTKASKAYKAWAAEQEARDIVSAEVWDKIQLAHTQAQSNPAVAQSLRLSQAEAVSDVCVREVRRYGTIEGTHVAGTPDCWHEGTLSDVKTTASTLDQRTLGRLVTDRYTHVQLAMYDELLRQDGFEVKRHEVVFQQSKAPYDSRVVEIPSWLIRDGARILLRWLDEANYCIANNVWPGLSTTCDELQIPTFYEEEGK